MAWGSNYNSSSPWAASNYGPTNPGPIYSPGAPGGVYTPPAPTAPAPSGGEEIPYAGSGGVPGYSGPMSPVFNFDPVPTFTYKDFQAPTAEEAVNEPGYAFRSAEGAKALERSAAARGVLRTGGHLTDVLKYGQNFASQEYGNTFERALKSYGAYYQGRKDQFAPWMAEWNMKANAERQRAMAEFNRYLEAGQMGQNAANANNANVNQVLT